MSLPVAAANPSQRIVAGLPFVEPLARRMAATMPHSIDIGDLVQDGVIGLIDAAHRFDEARGIKFETFAERRVRGAMIDALRKDAWPRGVRRQRRELEAAREELRRELGCEPSLADLAAKVGSDEKRLGRTIVRINAIESTSPLANNDHLDESHAAGGADPVRARAPGRGLRARRRRKDRVQAAIASLPPREQKVIGLYYYGEVDDEADWRRDRRQRIARVASCTRAPSAGCATRSADDGAGARPRRMLQVDRAAVPAEAGDGEGRRSATRAATEPPRPAS